MGEVYAVADPPPKKKGQALQEVNRIGKRSGCD
jgi:hypothetical protein